MCGASAEIGEYEGSGPKESCHQHTRSPLRPAQGVDRPRSPHREENTAVVQELDPTIPVDTIALLQRGSEKLQVW